MRAAQVQGKSKRSGKGPIHWLVIVLSLCAWSLFRAASDLRRTHVVVVVTTTAVSPPSNPTLLFNAHETETANRSRRHPSLEECPNAILKELFRPRSYYNLSAAQSVDSTGDHSRSPTLPLNLPRDARTNENGEDTSIVWELLGAELESAEEGRSPKKSSRRKVLVVVPGLGEAQRVNSTLTSLESLRRSVLDESGFACLVYVYKLDILEEVKGRMEHLCEVVFNRGMWTSHMKRVPPLTDLTTATTATAGTAAAAAPPSAVQSPALRRLAGGVTHVAVMMDDVDVADLDLPRFVALMEFAGFGAATPAFLGEQYAVMRKRCDCVYHRTDFVNVLFTVFTRRVWQCWQAGIDPAKNRHGWGMDMAVAGLCNTTSGVLDVFDSYHPRSSKEGRLYSAEEANQQLASWIVKHTKVKRESVREYRECVSVHRPLAAFPHCELYWDGTHRPEEAKSLAAEWDCAVQFLP
jgi:Protein of unknown function (DUF707)